MEPVAVIGMAGLFPGAKNLSEFWENVLAKKDCITDVPPTRWSIADYYDPDRNAPDKTYSKRGGFIPDIEFDPLEFGLAPKSLDSTDVSQLLSLTVAKAVLRDGGYESAEKNILERTGVVLGVSGFSELVIPLASRLQYPIWEKVLRSCALSEPETENVSSKIRKCYVRCMDRQLQLL